MVNLRPADIHDAQFVWDCRQALDGGVARSTTHRESFEDHRAWMDRAVKDSSRLFAIATASDGALLGYVRADPSAHGGWMTSLCLGAEYRGKGLSRQVLEQGCQHAVRNGFTPLLADIHIENPASRRVFSNCGFRPLDEHSPYANGLKEQFARYILDDSERNER